MSSARGIVQLLTLLTLCVGLGWATPVTAQASRERARDLFVRAGQAASVGAWTEAVDLYLESYVAFPHPSTLHNIGRCYHQRGDDYQALSFTARALYEAPPDGVSRLSEANRDAAEQQLSEMLARLGRVVLAADVELPDQIRVRVDGTPVATVPLRAGDGLLPVERAPPQAVRWRPGDALWLLPGVHEVHVSDGTRTGTARVDVQRGTTSSLVFDRWEPTEVAFTRGNTTSAAQPELGTSGVRSSAVVAAVTTRSVRVETDRDHHRSEDFAWRTWALGSWAVSAVGFGLGVGATLVANSLDADLDRACAGGDCPRRHLPEIERYDRTVTISYVGFGMGVLTALTGGVFWLSQNDAPATDAIAARSPHASPIVALDGDGLQLLWQGTF